jgi:hypothetical protein
MLLYFISLQTQQYAENVLYKPHLTEVVLKGGLWFPEHSIAFLRHYFNYQMVIVAPGKR